MSLYSVSVASTSTFTNCAPEQYGGGVLKENKAAAYSSA